MEKYELLGDLQELPVFEQVSSASWKGKNLVSIKQIDDFS